MRYEVTGNETDGYEVLFGGKHIEVYYKLYNAQNLAAKLNTALDGMKLTREQIALAVLPTCIEISSRSPQSVGPVEGAFDIADRFIAYRNKD